MIHKQDIKAVAKKMMRKHRGLRDPQIIHPQRDWLIGVCFSVIVFTVIAWWSATSYLAYSDIAVFGSAEGADTSVVYKKEQVEAALDLFSDRTDNYNQLLNNRVQYVPPPVVEEVATSTPDIVASSTLATTTEEVSE